jgi:plasmid stabilization system protein ParE
MSLELEISDRAQNDLAKQYSWYVKHATADVAERYLSAFYASALRLASHPGLGRTRKFQASELSGIRSFPMEGSFGVHLIFYRADVMILSIERIMHGARDIPRRLLK